MTLSALAIKRAPEFSPNHIDNDAMILEMTGLELEKQGVAVNYLSEDQLENNIPISDKFIFSMARNENSLNYLAGLEKSGVRVFNSAKGVKNCQRENMMNTFRDNGVLTPQFITVPTEDYSYAGEIAKNFERNKLWVKRSKHINHREDIVKIYSPEELGNLLKEFLGRNILKACVMEHIDGDEIKFYAVPEADYWYWYYANGNNKNPLDLKFLKKEIFGFATKFGLNFYGGDAIIDKNGNIYFIDLNDWPSFAPIRGTAAKKIAEVLYSKLNEHSNVATNYIRRES